MPTSTGPNIVKKTNLKTVLDAADVNSMLPMSTFLNMSPWTIGNGSAGPYGQNGSSDENERLLGTDPWGNSAIVWQSNPSGNGNDDGGWNNGFYDIDRTKLYRWSVWVKRTSSTSSGNNYFGLYGSGGTWGIERLDGGGIEGNPYWECSNAGAYTQNQWYLLVGHCFPAGTTGIPGNKHPDTGRYTINGRSGDLNYCNIGGDVRWLGDSTVGLHRTYHYYCGDNTTHLQWYDPRFEICDGTEPTISELLTNPATLFRDVSGNGVKGDLKNGVQQIRSNLGALTFDGTDDYVEFPAITLSGDFTISQVVTLQSTANGPMPIGGGYYTNGSTYLGYVWFRNNVNIVTIAVNGEQAVELSVNSSLWVNKTIIYTVTRQGTLATFYINGTKIASGTISTNNFDIRTIGYSYSFSYATTGTINNTFLYNTALSSNEVQQNYNQYKSRFNLS
jgi:hypothetical protein